VIDKLAQMIYYKYYAEVVEAYGINVSDAGAVPAASTTSAVTRVTCRMVTHLRVGILSQQHWGAFDGGEIGSTCVIKLRRDQRQIVNANDNNASRLALAA